MPPILRFALHLAGGGLMLLGVWGRLRALYLSEKVLIAFVLLVAGGYVLVALARGVLRASGLALLMLSIPDLLDYYQYGANGRFVGIAVAVLMMAAGIACLVRASSGRTIELSLKGISSP
jgi:hypothetical protein